MTYKIVTDREMALERENARLVDKTERQSATIHVQAVAIQAMKADAERLDWLETQQGSNLISDDACKWAVSTCGMQEVPPDGGFQEPTSINSIVMPEEWQLNIRAAIDAAMKESKS